MYIQTSFKWERNVYMYTFYMPIYMKQLLRFLEDMFKNVHSSNFVTAKCRNCGEQDDDLISHKLEYYMQQYTYELLNIILSKKR